MPAWKSHAIVAILLILTLTSFWLPTLQNHPNASMDNEMSTASSSGLNGALEWLANNQSSDGSYGQYLDHWAAAAAYALWLNNSRSSKPALSFRWISNQLDNPGSWFWGGEADVPGVLLFTISASANRQLIQTTTVASNLLQFQRAGGGFFGYYSLALQSSLTSSVDTAEALRGLISASAINSTSEGKAVSYLFGLQNPDGSFNLTKTKASDPIYSQGPEPVSITALVLLALKDASYTNGDSHVSKALSFINSRASYSTLANDTGAVYSASLAALAMSAYGRTTEAATATSFILSHQDPDGGFRDSLRGSAGSNALDTGWAAIALEQIGSSVNSTAPLPQIVLYGIAVGLVALAVVVVSVVYMVRRSRILNRTKNG